MCFFCSSLQLAFRLTGQPGAQEKDPTIELIFQSGRRRSSGSRRCPCCNAEDERSKPCKYQGAFFHPKNPWESRHKKPVDWSESLGIVRRDFVLKQKQCLWKKEAKISRREIKVIEQFRLISNDVFYL